MLQDFQRRFNFQQDKTHSQSYNEISFYCSIFMYVFKVWRNLKMFREAIHPFKRTFVSVDCGSVGSWLSCNQTVVSLLPSSSCYMLTCKILNPQLLSEDITCVLWVLGRTVFRVPHPRRTPTSVHPGCPNSNSAAEGREGGTWDWTERRASENIVFSI